MLNKTKMQYPNLITPFIIQTACINIHVSLKSFFFFLRKQSQESFCSQAVCFGIMAIFLNKILNFQRLTGQLTDKQFHDKEKPSPQIKQIKELILNFELEFHSS